MLDISVKDLRNEIKSKVLNNSLHLLLPKKSTNINYKFPSDSIFHYLPNEAFTLANYFYLFRIAELVAYREYTMERYNSMASASINKPLLELSNTKSKSAGILPIVGDLICEDTGKVNIFVACVAWLSTDGFNWSTINPMVPEDLSYNLVSQYFDYVVPFACVVADYRRNELVSKLSEESLESAYSQAVNDVLKFKPNSKNFKEFQVQRQIT